jgi:1,4-dihydroxy-2-naphthoate octaprenyltransferase
VIRVVGAFVRLGRPLFLGGGFLLYGLGAAVAVFAGAPFDPGRYLGGQLAVTAFQLMTHYANDYFDYEADLANTTPTRWSGGSRVLQGRELPRGAALIAALVLAVIGLLASAHAGTRPGAGPLLLPALLAIFALAWAYSAPPLRLCARGWGELDTALVVTALVPFVGLHVQAPALAGWRTLLLAITPLCALQFAMLVAIELPDRAGDASTGKRTLVVRLGGWRGARLYAGITALAFGVLPLLAVAGLPLAVAAAAAAPAPLALWRIRRALHGDWRRVRRWEALAFWAVALLVVTAAAVLMSFVILNAKSTVDSRQSTVDSSGVDGCGSRLPDRAERLRAERASCQLRTVDCRLLTVDGREAALAAL